MPSKTQTTGPEPKLSVMRIAPYVAGESKAAGAERLIRLAANEGAFGASPSAQAAFEAKSSDLHRYPDGGATLLRDTIAEVKGLEANRIVCGAGSDELIALLLMAYAGPGDEVLHTEHGFLMYSISALSVGAEPVSVPETNRTTDVDALLAAVTPKTKMVFIANPNNPTGTYLPAAEVHRLQAGLPSNVILVLDGAYAEYMTAKDYEAGVELVNASENVVMLRTFSKIHGLGGLRLGWCYASDAIADVLNRVRGPFNTSHAAQAAGAAAMRDAEFLERSVAHNTACRAWVTEALRGLGIQVADSYGNFILADYGDRDPEPLRLALKAEGILVRQMGGYGLPNCQRITIGTDEEMREVVATIERLLPTLDAAEAAE
ncbi:MAG: histidinol-phosphate transaminase [Alphaproteobacteria bacterium]|nr:histidinol-phosphate transaminase [Alphaproteobacteria bacterium SS10]